MSTELALQGAGQVAANYDENAFSAISGDNTYLGRLELYGANSGPCKEGKVPQGHYGIKRDDQIQVLGDQVDCFVLNMRMKALKWDDENVYNYFDPQSEKFKAVVVESAEKDSGCMAGYEYLLYIPSVGKFVTFFMASKTMRRESPNVKALLGKTCTLRSRLIKRGKYIWHGPLATPCVSPLEFSTTEAEYNTQRDKFLNPKDSTEEAEGSGNEGRDR